MSTGAPSRTSRGSTSRSITRPATRASTTDEAMLNQRFETGVTAAPASGNAPVTELVIPAKSASRLVTSMEVE
jgi:hypothetical protein